MPLPLLTAQRYADKIAAWLAPFCERLEIVGSIRRGLPQVNDVDIVCIPKLTETKYLLGAVAGRDNHLFNFLQGYIKDRNPLNSPGREPRFLSGGEKEGKQIMLQLPKCQLDLWFADRSTLATRVLCRTGSKEHNIWFADRATFRGLHWNPYEGLSRLANNPSEPSVGSHIDTPTEADLYAALGLAFIAPRNRELPWLQKNIDSGL